MTDILLPVWLDLARVNFGILDSTAAHTSPFNGIVRTSSRLGDRVRASVEWTQVGGATLQADRGALTASIARLGGRRNRALISDPSNRRRGAFPSQELITNNTFANGTSGWGPFSNGTHIVAERVSRVTLGDGAIGSLGGFGLITNVPVVQYAPYVARAMIMLGRGAVASTIAFCGSSNATSDQFQAPGTPGLVTAAGVVNVTSASFGFAAVKPNPGLFEDFVTIPYVSASRCALVDGGTNLLTRSDEFNDAVWGKSAATITANALTAPDGTTTADDLIDTAVNTTHAVSRSGIAVPSAAADVHFSIAVRARNRNFCSLQIADGSTSVTSTFNVSAGTLGVGGSTGASWSNKRQFIRNMGGGWHQVSIVARKAAGVTSLTLFVYAANGDGLETYTGSGTAAIALWRATLSLSGAPARLVQTGASVSSGENQIGSGLHLKGLPASTVNLLLPGDPVEVIGGRGSELKIVTEALHSNAAGQGYLQFDPPIRVSPVDNAAVIVTAPIGRFIFAGGGLPEWQTEPGLITRASAEFDEA